MTRAAVVIPAYNEAGTIREVAQRALRHIPWLIVVDDGSTDGTGEALSGLPLTLLRNSKNSGKGASLCYAGHRAGADRRRSAGHLRAHRWRHRGVVWLHVGEPAGHGHHAPFPGQHHQGHRGD
jgi:hypothetical protein